MVSWRISVTDIQNNRGVADAGVYLFVGGGGIVEPELADYSGKTGADGAVILDVPEDFYRVGIVAPGYESAHDPHTPPEEWKDTWTCWGAGGAGYDYDFAVKPSAAPPTPPGFFDQIGEWWSSLPWWQKTLVLAGSGTAIAAAVYLAKKR